MKNKQEILDVLQNHFGFEDFRPGQEETIVAVDQENYEHKR